jgi:2-keto-myo-inositol isomerase
MARTLSRREMLAAATTTTLGLLSAGHVAWADDAPKGAFRYSLNTSTISGQKLTLVQEIELAAKAGYDGIEPWVRELDGYVKGGGNLKDLAKMLADKQLFVANAIGFFEWIVDDEARRTKGLAEATRVMEILAQLGCKHVAAPPCGADRAPIPTEKAAERYGALLDLGAKSGVKPMMEVWGRSKTLGRLEDAAAVCVACGKPQACMLLDVFHLYRGGSDFGGVKLLSGAAIHVIHVNDYPASPPREKITDADRVYPGDGVAPLAALFRDLAGIGFRGALSLELFNREYWKQDALTVARTGLEKTRALVRRSLEG